MTTVLILANGSEKKFWNAVRNILGRNFSAVYCIGGCLDARGAEAQFVIADAGSFDLVYSDQTIVVFKDANALPCGIESGKQAVAIVDSGNADAVRAVSDSKLPAITCGLSAKDTITLSSINEDSAVIDLQRSVTCFDGTVIEPQEIPVSLNACIDNFALMCTACIFILSGNIKKLANTRI